MEHHIFRDNQMDAESIQHRTTEERIANIAWHDLTDEEISEAEGDTNRYFTWKEVGHEPTEEELLKHFIQNSEALHRRMGILSEQQNTAA